MNTGIIVFSHTGNTLLVARRLQERLSRNGHTVILEEITVQGGFDPEKDFNSFTLDSVPDPSQYDAVVFGAPVMAFSLCPVMKRYLESVRTLSGLKVGLLVTQHLPFKWMGGSRAVGQMKKLSSVKGGMVKSAGIVNWSHRDREARIDDAVTAVASGLK